MMQNYVLKLWLHRVEQRQIKQWLFFFAQTRSDSLTLTGCVGFETRNNAQIA